jgi:hypothetical protein
VRCAFSRAAIDILQGNPTMLLITKGSSIFPYDGPGGY